MSLRDFFRRHVIDADPAPEPSTLDRMDADAAFDTLPIATDQRRTTETTPIFDAVVFARHAVDGSLIEQLFADEVERDLAAWTGGAR